jgi:glucosamine--fructose-6-phosphate aminotransferase (isomerizing)
MCIVHSRFAEVRRFYTGNNIDEIHKIPHHHAHPNIDTDNKIALFHNGFISNFEELKMELKNKTLSCGDDINSLTDSQLITALIADKMKDDKCSLKEALMIIIEEKLLGTYRIAVVEIKNPKSIFFVKNSG